MEDLGAGTACRGNCHSYSFSLIPSFPTKAPLFPEGNEPWEKAIGVDTVSGNQWVWAYLEENKRVPKWWWEFQSLLQHPCDSAIQKLACKQAAAFWIPAAELEKVGWWTSPPCLEVLGRGNTFPWRISRETMTTEYCMIISFSFKDWSLNQLTSVSQHIYIYQFPAFIAHVIWISESLDVDMFQC